ncbi:MAG: porin [Acidobacteria bacterium]|nr:porin [Acidobacteriota bacterium]
MKVFLRGATVAAVVLALGAGGAAWAQTVSDPPAGPRLQIYGFVQLDMIADFNAVNPDWADTLRPTRLPSYKDEFGPGGHFYADVKQTRFGVKGWLPTGFGELKTCFEFDLFGVGGDAGQTTMRVRQAWAELGPFLVGQTQSVFMDLDVFPNTLDYWGPNGMVFYRNIQLRWMPVQGDTRVWIALEQPGASGDGGVYSDRVELQNIQARFSLPDLTAQFRSSGKWGHVQLAGVLRQIKWDDTLVDQYDLSGSATGWGLNLSTNLKAGANDVIRASVIYGEGVENYMNDAPLDVGVQTNPGDKTKPIKGKALPVLGIVAFLDHNWSDKFSTAIGYSRVDISNSDGQLPSDFKTGQYAAVNLLWTPVKNVMTGAEFLWGNRKNNSDGFSSDDYRIQVSFKANFDTMLGGKK